MLVMCKGGEGEEPIFIWRKNGAPARLSDRMPLSICRGLPSSH